MIRFKNILVLLLILTCGVVVAQKSSFPKSIQKKIDKEVQKIFLTEDIVMVDDEHLNLNAFSCEGVKGLSLSKLKSNETFMGFACFASSKGKNDYFDYMVLLNTNLEIQKVVVLIYRSSYGGEIMAKSWLKQFEGKVRGEEMEFGKDIDGISGATISAPSMTKGVKSISLFLSELKAKGKI